MQLQSMLEMGTRATEDWHPPVLKTAAVNAEGIEELVNAFWSHREYLLGSGEFSAHNFEQSFQLLRRLVMEMAADKVFNASSESKDLQTLLDALKKHHVDPFTAAEKLVKNL